MASRAMKERAAKHEPFSAAELDGVLASLQRAAAAAAAASSSVEDGEGGGSSSSSSSSSSTGGGGGGGAAPIDWATLRALLGKAAHLSHKDWVRTESAADSLGDVLGGPANASFRDTFHRVLEDGKWDSAAAAPAAAPAAPAPRPWAVLVTGLNGIRKTTSVYQPWFQEALAAALGGEAVSGVPARELPSGGNSFFRQLDYMIATVASDQFTRLYEAAAVAAATAAADAAAAATVAADAATNAAADAADDGPAAKRHKLAAAAAAAAAPAAAACGDGVGAYVARKDAIFARYRTLAEMLGALLCKAARGHRMNVMVESSGRDVAMYEYLDHFFPEEEQEEQEEGVQEGGAAAAAAAAAAVPSYRKLAVHFEINDLRFAERSVDARMAREMRDGRAALLPGRGVRDVIGANAGGPYGSGVLAGVQAASEAVWAQVRDGEVEAGRSWLKATIRIDGHESDGGWTATAIGADGASCGKTFRFE